MILINLFYFGLSLLTLLGFFRGELYFYGESIVLQSHDI